MPDARPTLPADYLERVYAGVLGKLVGVYLGRPFEGWSHERILEELGTIEGYVSERFGAPLVVTDDDVSGTFSFVRALAEHGAREDLSSEEIGRTWLNLIVEGRSILWWGGNGTSTEHTAWLNLKRGVLAPESGSAARNGRTLAEQIGAEIFVDGWAMVAPGRPALAARLAEAAARVSHDGEAVHAAKLVAAAEAEAFVSSDMNHLLDTGLAQIPGDCLIAKLVADVRAWHAAHPDWRDTRALVARHYGYDSFPGICHVVPNHALVVMALLYADGDFGRAMKIVNTSGCDTDCNAGNVGCLLGLMLGLSAFDGSTDWRGPIADRTLISSADGGYAINDAARLAYDVADLGHRLAGLQAPARPKDAARFHFTLPGSVQGFRPDADATTRLAVEQAGVGDEAALLLRFRGLGPGRTLYAGTPTFAPPEVVSMRSYELMASPLVYPGQTIEARLAADPGNRAAVTVHLRLKVYGRDDRLDPVDGPAETLAPGAEARLRWKVPDLDGQPIAEVGLALGAGTEADGVVRLHALGWSGAPDLRLRRPREPGDFWRRAWVNGVSTFLTTLPEAFRISQDGGEGIAIHGTREWEDYRVSSRITVHLGRRAGLAVRVQGLRRYYALLLEDGSTARLVKLRDGDRTVLAEAAFPWSLDAPQTLAVEASGTRLVGTVGPLRLEAHDDEAGAFRDGGIGLLVAEGALSTDEVVVAPLAS